MVSVGLTDAWNGEFVRHSLSTLCLSRRGAEMQAHGGTSLCLVAASGPSNLFPFALGSPDPEFSGAPQFRASLHLHPQPDYASGKTPRAASKAARLGFPMPMAQDPLSWSANQGPLCAQSCSGAVISGGDLGRRTEGWSPGHPGLCCIYSPALHGEGGGLPTDLLSRTSQQMPQSPGLSFLLLAPRTVGRFKTSSLPVSPKPAAVTTVSPDCSITVSPAAVQPRRRAK